MAAISSARTRASWRDSPPPPYSAGQVGTPQPLAPMASRHWRASGLSLPPPAAAVCAATSPFRALGKLSSSQALASLRKVSRSPPKSAMEIRLYKIMPVRTPVGRKCGHRLCATRYLGSGSPSTRLEMTFRFTSLVPPSMELPFERSQPRVAMISPGL